MRLENIGSLNKTLLVLGPPSKYRGGKLREVNLTKNGMKAWAFLDHQIIVQAVVKNLVDNLHKKGEKLPEMAPTPLSCKYRLENGEKDASYHHSIGVLRWIVELGCVDIDVEVSMMSSHLPCTASGVGHLHELYHLPHLCLSQGSRLSKRGNAF
jgi:hypothetical protein